MAVLGDQVEAVEVGLFEDAARRVFFEPKGHHEKPSPSDAASLMRYARYCNNLRHPVAFARLAQLSRRHFRRGRESAEFSLEKPHSRLSLCPGAPVFMTDPDLPTKPSEKGVNPREKSRSEIEIRFEGRKAELKVGLESARAEFKIRLKC